MANLRCRVEAPLCLGGLFSCPRASVAELYNPTPVRAMCTRQKIVLAQTLIGRDDTHRARRPHAQANCGILWSFASSSMFCMIFQMDLWKKPTTRMLPLMYLPNGASAWRAWITSDPLFNWHWVGRVIEIIQIARFQIFMAVRIVVHDVHSS